MAPEVAGRIIKLPVADNQFAHKGDELFEIDPADYRIVHEQAQALAQRLGRERCLLPVAARISSSRAHSRRPPARRATLMHCCLRASSADPSAPIISLHNLLARVLWRHRDDDLQGLD